MKENCLKLKKGKKTDDISHKQLGMQTTQMI